MVSRRGLVNDRDLLGSLRSLRHNETNAKQEKTKPMEEKEATAKRRRKIVYRRPVLVTSEVIIFQSIICYIMAHYSH